MAYFENTKHDIGMVYESDNAWNEGDIKISKAEYKSVLAAKRAVTKYGAQYIGDY